MILIGHSGVGKTLIISLLAKEALLPMVETKITGKSSEGYVGDHLSNIFRQLRTKTNGEAPYGIISLDEIDKLVENHNGFFGDRKQDELIGWLEEANINTSLDSKSQENKENRLNTKNLLFVTAGAFGGVTKDSLEEIIKKRLNQDKATIGFLAEEIDKKSKEYNLGKTLPEDLISYGFKTELVGRLPSIVILDPLSIEDKINILTKSRNSPLNKYFKLFKLKGYDLKIDPKVYETIVSYCPDQTGARALKSVCNNLFTRILFDPAKFSDNNKTIKITQDLTKELVTLYK
jgi:ATP-dependent Clp protease ATP-binding subunit ClpX